MAGALDKDIATPPSPGAAWVFNPTSNKWEKPSKPSTTKSYTWDDTKGWVEGVSNTASLSSMTGFVFTKAILEDATYGEELRNVYTLWDSGKVTDALNLYYNTKWYKNLGKTAADRYTLKKNQPAVYATELEAYKIAQKQRLSRVGVKIDDAELDKYLQEAFDGALSEGQLDAVVAKSASFGTKFGGDSLAKIQNFREYANSFGMTYDEAKYRQWGMDLFSGNITEAEIEQQIRQESASAFPALSDQIMKGTSLDALASAYKNTMATLLEIDADSIGYNDPTLRRALQNIGPDGKPAVKPLWQFEKDLRMDSRWQYTNNARNTIDSMSLKVLQDWGLA